MLPDAADSPGDYETPRIIQLRRPLHFHQGIVLDVRFRLICPDAFGVDKAQASVWGQGAEIRVIEHTIAQAQPDAMHPDFVVAQGSQPGEV